MASHVYPKFMELALGAGGNLASGNVKAVLLTAAYTYSAAHQFQSDLSGTIAASPNLSGKSITNGIFNATNATLTAVAGGSTIAAIAAFVDTGTPTTSPLIFFEDGFSQLTNGGDIVVAWDTGSNKIFTI